MGGGGGTASHFKRKGGRGCIRIRGRGHDGSVVRVSGVHMRIIRMEDGEVEAGQVHSVFGPRVSSNLAQVALLDFAMAIHSADLSAVPGPQGVLMFADGLAKLACNRCRDFRDFLPLPVLGPVQSAAMRSVGRKLTLSPEPSALNPSKPSTSLNPEP